MSKPEQKQPHATVNLQQIRVLNNLLRQEILSTLWSRGPGSARDIANRLGVDEMRLYYHLQILLRAKLIQTVASRPTATKPEAIYSAAGAVHIAGFDLTDPDVVQEIARNSDVTFRITAQDHRSALTCLDAPTAEKCLLIRNSVRLTEEARQELERRIFELAKWVTDHESDNGEPCSVLLSTAPLLNRGK